ncbi:MAG: YqhV family protein [Firmicutes bacterium]|nr:YqhV family protein [Bacillota bacterium]HXL03467.1 YqhV family protein [Bacillota bacterium]
MNPHENPVFLMASLRVIGAGVEIAAAILMLKVNTVETALRINAVLGLIGPVVLIAVSILGLWGLVERVSFTKLVMTLCGVILIIAGTG